MLAAPPRGSRLSWNDKMGRSAVRAIRRSAGAAVLATLVLSQPSFAQRKAYWLTKPGVTHVTPCPGNTAGEPLKIGRDFLKDKDDAGDDDRWLIVSGLVTCRDAGSEYVYAIEFLNVAVNPAERAGLERGTLSFDWIGLAAYRGSADGRAVDWLLDEALPIRGSLQRDATQRVTFGDLTFRVPKPVAGAATHFTFYITAEGLLWHLPVL